MTRLLPSPESISNSLSWPHFFLGTAAGFAATGPLTFYAPVQFLFFLFGGFAATYLRGHSPLYALLPWIYHLIPGAILVFNDGINGSLFFSLGFSFFCRLSARSPSLDVRAISSFLGIAFVKYFAYFEPARNINTMAVSNYLVPFVAVLFSCYSEGASFVKPDHLEPFRKSLTFWRLVPFFLSSLVEFFVVMNPEVGIVMTDFVFQVKHLILVASRLQWVACLLAIFSGFFPTFDFRNALNALRLSVAAMSFYLYSRLNLLQDQIETTDPLQFSFSFRIFFLAGVITGFLLRNIHRTRGFRYSWPISVFVYFATRVAVFESIYHLGTESVLCCLSFVAGTYSAIAGSMLYRLYDYYCRGSISFSYFFFFGGFFYLTDVPTAERLHEVPLLVDALGAFTLVLVTLATGARIYRSENQRPKGADGGTQDLHS